MMKSTYNFKPCFLLCYRLEALDKALFACWYFVIQILETYSLSAQKQNR